MDSIDETIMCSTISKLNKVNKKIPSCLKWYKEKTKNFYLLFPMLSPNIDGIVALGGNLSLDSLLESYTKGIFPWYEENPIKWYSPFWRSVFFLEKFKISKSFAKFLKKKNYQISFDNNFLEVIKLCASIPRKDQRGTWITKEMQQAYLSLHHLGVAHSVEIKRWVNNRLNLVGGLYGVSLGKAFFGESMFSLEPNTSKLALYELFLFLKRNDFHFIDCQLPTEHLTSLGATKINRPTFLNILHQSNQFHTLKGNWQKISNNLLNVIYKSSQRQIIKK